MTWSYGPSDGIAIVNDIDRVRLLIGDTDKDAPLLQDEEIVGLLDLTGTVAGAASLSCRSLAGRFSQSVDIRIGSKSVSAGSLATRYGELADKYDALSSDVSFAVPMVVGIVDANASNRLLWDQVGDASIPWWNWAMLDVEEQAP